MTANWLEIAVAELGVHETPGPASTERIREYFSATSLGPQPDDVPWCSAFVNWVMREAGIPRTCSALAASWLRWGVPCDPKPGCVVVIRKKLAGGDRLTGSSTGNHVGFWISQTATRIRLLGGNQSDQVKYSDFSLLNYDIRGYRWPAQEWLARSAQAA